MAIIYDIDNNAYDTIIIGTQEWIVQNLRTTHYADGSSLAVQDGMWYNDDPANKEIYGAIYTLTAAINPLGLVYFKRGGVVDPSWRIPTWDDFLLLVDALGGYLDTNVGAYFGMGGAKEIGTNHWNSPNGEATNLSGLTITGTGRYDSGHEPAFYDLKDWGGIRVTGNPQYNIVLWSKDDGIVYPYYNDSGCFEVSIRCMRDINTTTQIITTTQPPLMRGVTISQKSVGRVTSTDLVPYVTFSVNPGLGNSYEFLDMFINASYKPSSVILSMDKSFSDCSTVYASKITTYNPGRFYIHGFPKTTGKKVLIGKVLFVKVLFDDQNLFYDLKSIQTGFREILGG
jgi:Fibrobacter succinogenes major domain (Fib_succ_major).